MPLSIDLRERIVAAVDSGMHIDDVAKIFKVSRRVIYKWLKLRKETNSLAPKTGYQKGHSHKITDWDQFSLFAAANKHHTVKGMIVVWEKLNNETISESVMERALKKIGYTSKKKLLVMPNQAKKNVKNFWTK